MGGKNNAKSTMETIEEHKGGEIAFDSSISQGFSPALREGKETDSIRLGKGVWCAR
jgi:hypothetical protein